MGLGAAGAALVGAALVLGCAPEERWYGAYEPPPGEREHRNPSAPPAECHPGAALWEEARTAMGEAAHAAEEAYGCGCYAALLGEGALALLLSTLPGLDPPPTSLLQAFGGRAPTDEIDLPDLEGRAGVTCATRFLLPSGEARLGVPPFRLDSYLVGARVTSRRCDREPPGFDDRCDYEVAWSAPGPAFAVLEAAGPVANPLRLRFSEGDFGGDDPSGDDLPGVEGPDFGPLLGLLRLQTQRLVHHGPHGAEHPFTYVGEGELVPLGELGFWSATWLPLRPFEHRRGAVRVRSTATLWVDPGGFLQAGHSRLALVQQVVAGDRAWQLEDDLAGHRTYTCLTPFDVGVVSPAPKPPPPPPPDGRGRAEPW